MTVEKYNRLDVSYKLEKSEMRLKRESQCWIFSIYSFLGIEKTTKKSVSFFLYCSSFEHATIIFKEMIKLIEVFSRLEM